MDTASKKEIRRIPRFSLALPIRVESRYDQNSGWNEITRLSNVSVFGAGFNLRHNVKRGRLLQLTIPLPRQMRCYDYTEPQYRVWALVRSAIVIENPAAEVAEQSVGVAFIGKHPPPSYFDDPNKIYQIEQQTEDELWSVVEVKSDGSAAPRDLRNHSRLAIPTDIVLEKLDADGNVTAREVTVTENLSLSGAAIFSTLMAEPGEFLRVRSEVFNVSILSVVRGKRLGQDGLPRLHIEFIDRFFPLEGLE